MPRFLGRQLPWHRSLRRWFLRTTAVTTNTAYHCKEPCPETGGAFVCATSARFWCSRRRDLQDSANQERRPSEVVVFAACLSIARLRRRTATVGDESSVTPAGASARTPVERFRMLMPKLPLERVEKSTCGEVHRWMAPSLAAGARIPLRSSTSYAAITTSIGTPNSTGQRCA